MKRNVKRDAVARGKEDGAFVRLRKGGADDVRSRAIRTSRATVDGERFEPHQRS